MCGYVCLFVDNDSNDWEAYLEPIWISKATATVVDAFIEFLNFHFVCLTIESKLYKFDKRI
jgi:hypothetical protein